MEVEVKDPPVRTRVAVVTGQTIPVEGTSYVLRVQQLRPVPRIVRLRDGSTDRRPGCRHPPLLQAQVPCPLVEGVACGIGLAELLVRLTPAKARSGSFAAVGGRASSGLGPELAALLGRTIS